MSNPLPLSVAIITLNEADNLPRCLESIKGLAREIVIIDSGSTDATAEIAKQHGATFQFQQWLGHVGQKNVALERCSQPWVLCLDADEAVSPELADSIRNKLSSASPRESGYWINRRTHYLGEWIWHCWYPELRLRLVRQSQARWAGRDPHDTLEVQGDTAKLQGDLFHYSYRNLQDHLHRTINYARISAGALHQAGKRPRWHNLAFSPLMAFLKKIVVRQGWRDGWRGWIIAIATGIGVFSKYAFLFEMHFHPKAPPQESTK